MVSTGSCAAEETLANMTQRFSGYGLDAPEMALRQLMQVTRLQGTVMAFGDVFLAVAGLFVVFGAMVLNIAPYPPAEMSGATGH